MLAAILALLLFGIVGVGREGVFNFDGSVLYAAGVTWLAHGNPYDHAQLAAAVKDVPGVGMETLGFFYPPQAAAICLTLGLFPYRIAESLWLLANLTAIAVIVWTVARVGVERGWKASVPAALAIGNPFTLHVVWMGQTSLVAFAATAAAWSLSNRGKWLGAGICLGLASFKPQMSIAVVLWFLLDRNWRALAVAAATAAAMAVIPLLQQGGAFGALAAWYDGLHAGYGLPFNLPNFSHKVGLQSLIFAIGGVSVPSVILTSLCVVLTIMLWLYRRRFDSVTTLALLMIVTVTCSVYLHDYDYVALVPAYAALWRIAQRDPSGMALGVVLLGLLFVPQRIIRATDITPLYQWRSLVVIAIGVAITLGMRVRTRPDDSPAFLGEHR